MTALLDAGSVLDRADVVRQSISKRLRKKQELQQYFSSARLARFMASMMDYSQREIRILDPGAGIGSLFAACIEEACMMERPPSRIAVTAYEIDSLLHDNLNGSLEGIRQICEERGVEFSSKPIGSDFIMEYLRGKEPGDFTHVIMNPPYRKIRASSQMREALLDAGLQYTNKYAAFIGVSCRLLVDGGQMVFISPRSFCNGKYFCRFRKDFLESMSLKRIHLFGSRTSSFRDDDVLQENVIMHAKKGIRRGMIVVSSSRDLAGRVRRRRVECSDVVFNGDPQCFIHIVPDAPGDRISRMIRGLECTLEDLGISVSTGKVVDFRIMDHLKHRWTDGAVPLIRPFNISGGTVKFPLEDRKHHNFIVEDQESRRLLVENGNYVVVKRFTTLEEKRRVVAAVWTGKDCEARLVGFENRTNYFHRNGAGLDYMTARGLWAFLNSTAIDSYFRQFNGNTQVNATDLRYLRYPSEERLRHLGLTVDGQYDQRRVDDAVTELLAR